MKNLYIVTWDYAETHFVVEAYSKEEATSHVIEANKLYDEDFPSLETEKIGFEITYNVDELDSITELGGVLSGFDFLGIYGGVLVFDEY